MAKINLEEVNRVHFFVALVDDSSSMKDEPQRLKSAVIGINAWLARLRALELGFREKDNGFDSQSIAVSALLLNRGWIFRDMHIDDVRDVDEHALVSNQATPLWESWLKSLQALNDKVQGWRSKGGKARGYLYAVTDGEANPGTAQSIVDEAKALTAKLLNPTTAGGGKATQLISIIGIPIGPNARAFYEEVGVPKQDIFEPDLVSGDGCGLAIVDAMYRASIKSLSPLFLPKDLNNERRAISFNAVTGKPEPEPEQTELLGDKYLRLTDPRNEPR